MPLHVVNASCMLHVSGLKLCLKSLQVPLNNATHNSAYKGALEMLVVLWSVGQILETLQSVEELLDQLHSRPSCKR